MQRYQALNFSSLCAAAGPIVECLQPGRVSGRAADYENLRLAPTAAWSSLGSSKRTSLNVRSEATIMAPTAFAAAIKTGG